MRHNSPKCTLTKVASSEEQSSSLFFLPRLQKFDQFVSENVRLGLCLITWGKENECDKVRPLFRFVSGQCVFSGQYVVERGPGACT